MPKFFLIGQFRENSGPSYVNKGLISHLSGEFWYLASEATVPKMLEATWKTLFSQVVIVSGVSRCGAYMMRLAKLLRKKSVYLMHGCVQLEAELEQAEADPAALGQEQAILELADLILPVSRRYCLLIGQRYPQYRKKLHFLHNGVEKPDFVPSESRRIPGSVIAVGGDRKIKNNLTVAKAMKNVPGAGILTVYGTIREPDRLPRHEKIQFKGLVSREELYQHLGESQLYVLNSICEPFALSIFDALFCGCSILVSSAAGALEVLNLQPGDVILDPMDEKEIGEKIARLLEQPNNKRILQSLDPAALSYRAEVEKLARFCRELQAGKQPAPYGEERG